MNRNAVSRTTFRQRLEHMVEQLRRDMRSGKLAAGEFLPSEDTLGERFRLSKNSVRKGLDVLVAEQSIEKLPRIGNRVTGRTKPEPEQEPAPVTIRLGLYEHFTQDIADFSALIDRFHERYPHICVQTLALSYNPQTTADYIAGGVVDALVVNETTYQYLAERDGLRHLEPLAVDPAVYPFLYEALPEAEPVCIHPVSFSPVVICYNADHFAERKVPVPDNDWTWDDLNRISALLTAGDRYGFYFHFPSNNRWPLFFLQSGAAFARDASSGRWSIDEPAVTEALRTAMNAMRQPGFFPPYWAGGESDEIELFRRGDVSMIMATYFSLNRLRDAGIRFDVLPLPALRERRT
ncbi:MAG: extracellular solute-binding protein, partial [Paenibacillaceae bacterium]|nr:extracellular solute-binding protein [Paenibacillaceae bacterium]